MSQKQHSPGPWKVDGCRILDCDDNVIIGDYGNGDTYCTFHEFDMAAIASTPEFAKVLRTVALPYVDASKIDGAKEDAETIRALLAKAGY